MNLLAQLSYFLISATFAYNCLNKSKTSKIILDAFVKLICLLHTAHNIPLVCMWLLKLKLIDKLNLSRSVYLFYMIAKADYFSQGNSNGLSTIQISSGFVGFNEYYPVLIGLFLFLSTYSAKFFWFMQFLNAEQ
jgi:hypothetical protein